jgi:hypothetical protein
MPVSKMDFHSTHVFSVKKADNSVNFTGGGIINHRMHHNSVETRTNIGDQLCDGLQGNESCETTLHVRSLSSFCISCQK